jgi:hypothetical protein
MNKIASVALIAAIAGFAAVASAQQPVPAPLTPVPPSRDFTKTVINTTDLGNNTYMLAGEGGNITVT